MGATAHLGIGLGEYDARIRTFIPHYREMIEVAAASAASTTRGRALVVDLGIGSGALSAAVLVASPRARIVGIDSDADMLAVARRRLGRRVTTIEHDFLSAPLPRAHAIVSSFALHHVATRIRKRALYTRCAAALRPGGAMVIADCCLASFADQQRRDRAAWLGHLQKVYPRAKARGYLRTWAREDVYQRLDVELALLAAAGFVADVPWRRDSFAVIVARRAASTDPRARAGRRAR